MLRNAPSDIRPEQASPRVIVVASLSLPFLSIILPLTRRLWLKDLLIKEESSEPCFATPSLRYTYKASISYIPSPPSCQTTKNSQPPLQRVQPLANKAHLRNRNLLAQTVVVIQFHVIDAEAQATSTRRRKYDAKAVRAEVSITSSCLPGCHGAGPITAPLQGRASGTLPPKKGAGQFLTPPTTPASSGRVG